MKKNWNNPAIEDVSINDTMNSTQPNTETDGAYGDIFGENDGYGTKPNCPVCS